MQAGGFEIGTRWLPVREDQSKVAQLAGGAPRGGRFARHGLHKSCHDDGLGGDHRRGADCWLPSTFPGPCCRVAGAWPRKLAYLSQSGCLSAVREPGICGSLPHFTGCAALPQYDLVLVPCFGADG